MNFLFLLKRLSLVLLLVGCSNLRRSNTPVNPMAEQVEANQAVPKDEAIELTNSGNEEASSSKVIKIGVILGPGALKAFAHIGALRELVKAKLPISGIVGIEMGALVGALYAQKGQVFDPEWQMMKLKEDELLDRSLISANKARDISSLNKFFEIAFAGRKVEDSKIQFSCPALNMAKRTVFMMSRGAFSQMLPYCLPLPPVFRPFNQNIAAAHDLKASVDYLKSKGANYLILVNVVNTNSFEDQPFWGMIAHSLLQQSKLVDYVIHVPIEDLSLVDFDKRREMMQRGAQAAQKAVQDIQSKLGL